ncbi:hypothetical protein AO262_24490 [Pseudomonas fluorescens ABAC62]|nr:hypothetical protein AO262_24490 [Pseudomonas fluorescens ABAC62]
MAVSQPAVPNLFNRTGCRANVPNATPVGDTKIFNPQVYGIQDGNNKTLAPQEGTGYEVGVKGNFNDDKVNTSLAVFKIDQDNLPVYQRAP